MSSLDVHVCKARVACRCICFAVVIQHFQQFRRFACQTGQICCETSVQVGHVCSDLAAMHMSEAGH